MSWSGLDQDEAEQIWHLWNLRELLQARRLQLKCSDLLPPAAKVHTKTLIIIKWNMLKMLELVSMLYLASIDGL